MFFKICKTTCLKTNCFGKLFIEHVEKAMVLDNSLFKSWNWNPQSKQRCYKTHDAPVNCSKVQNQNEPKGRTPAPKTLKTN